MRVRAAKISCEKALDQPGHSMHVKRGESGGLLKLGKCPCLPDRFKLCTTIMMIPQFTHLRLSFPGLFHKKTNLAFLLTLELSQLLKITTNIKIRYIYIMYILYAIYI